MKKYIATLLTHDSKRLQKKSQMKNPKMSFPKQIHNNKDIFFLEVNEVTLKRLQLSCSLINL